MSTKILPALLLTVLSGPAWAIELDCNRLADQVLEGLDSADLLRGERQRARAIVVSACGEREADVQQQHEQEKEAALKNWFMESTGGKPGNERLRRLK